MSDFFLHIGDFVVLEDLAAGCVMSSEGHDADTTVVVDEPAAGQASHRASAIFLVRAQQNYRCEKQLAATLEANDISRASARAVPQFRELL